MVTKKIMIIVIFIGMVFIFLSTRVNYFICNVSFYFKIFKSTYKSRESVRHLLKCTQSRLSKYESI